MASQADDERPDDEPVRAWGGVVVKLLLAIVSIVYFGCVFAEANKAGTAARLLPAPLAYFTQIAALFPGAARSAIDYRVEGWRCKDKAWAEIDVRPWFPIDADNKENRFYRTMHFFGEHPHRETLRALDEFITSHYERDRIAAEARGDGRPAVGGVRFVRVKVPIGQPGEDTARYSRLPLASYAEDDRNDRKDFYWTPESRRDARCAQLGAF